MLSMFALVVAAVCLGVGLVTKQVGLSWAAFAVSLTVLVAVAGYWWATKRGGVARTGGASVVSPGLAIAAEDQRSGDNQAISGGSEGDHGPTATETKTRDLAGVVAKVTASEEAQAAEPDTVANESGGAGPSLPGETGSPERLAAPAQPEPDSDRTVLVIEGRRRYHRRGCRLLADWTPDEISFVEAQEEGFTACSACVPRAASRSADAPTPASSH